MLIPAGNAKFSGIVRGNKTLGAILELLQQETDEAAVTEAMCKTFNGDPAQIARDEELLLQDWEELPPSFRSSSSTGMGREEILGYIDNVLANHNN